jgi:hypothetical protein
MIPPIPPSSINLDSNPVNSPEHLRDHTTMTTHPPHGTRGKQGKQAKRTPPMNDDDAICQTTSQIPVPEYLTVLNVLSVRGREMGRESPGK